MTEPVEHPMLTDDEREHIQHEGETCDQLGTEQAVRQLLSLFGDELIGHQKASYRATLLDTTVRLAYERALKARDGHIASVLKAAEEMLAALEATRGGAVRVTGHDEAVVRWRAALDGPVEPPRAGDPERCCVCAEPAAGATHGGPHAQIRFPHCGGDACRIRVHDAIDGLFTKRKPGAREAVEASAADWHRVADDRATEITRLTTELAAMKDALPVGPTTTESEERIAAANAPQLAGWLRVARGTAYARQLEIDHLIAARGIDRNELARQLFNCRPVRNVNDTIEWLRMADRAIALCGGAKPPTSPCKVCRSVEPAGGQWLCAYHHVFEPPAASPDLWPDFKGDHSIAELFVARLASKIPDVGQHVHEIAAVAGEIRARLAAPPKERPRFVLSVDWPSVWEAGPHGVEIGRVGKLVISTWPNAWWQVEGPGVRATGNAPAAGELATPRDRARAAARSYVMGLNGATLLTWRPVKGACIFCKTPGTSTGGCEWCVPHKLVPAVGKADLVAYSTVAGVVHGVRWKGDNLVLVCTGAGTTDTRTAATPEVITCVACNLAVHP